ncbi:hypothetical protein ABTY00_38560 [Streptomyces microflavus]|uniref:hypothetical protein n=1 Tax=Streptomyces microflavus TaxID=1919 RepID=UPI003320969F
MATHAFKLTFSQIACMGCGTPRIRSITCPDCGHAPQPWEVDEAGFKRRETAARAQVLLEQPVTAPPSRTPDAPQVLHAELFRRLRAWMDIFFQAVGATAGGAEQAGAQDLEEAVRDFLELRVMVHSADPRRPLKVLAALLRQLVSELAPMMDAYLTALLAPTPLEAQNRGAVAQRHLDRAAELFREAAALAEAATELAQERDVARIHTVLLAQALKAYKAPHLLELDRAARDELRDVTSSRGVNGSGVMFAPVNVLAQSIFDPDQFREVLRRAYQVFSSNPHVLRELAQEPSFESDFSRAICELFDGSMEALHAVDHAAHPRQAGRALLGIASSQVEGPGQVIATALLLACGRKPGPYANLRHKNATELVTAVQRESALQGLLDGLDNDLRTGRAHALVRYEQDFAVIERKKGCRTVAWLDVVDGVFQAYESIYACQLALWQALGELGFTKFAVDGLWAAMGLTAEQMTTFVLEMAGCRCVVITAGDRQWRIEAQAETAIPLPTLTALIRPYLPEYVDDLSFTAHQKDGIHTLSGPLAPWHAYDAAAGDSDAQPMAYLRAQLAWTYDSAPVVSADLVRRWTARQAEVALMETPREAIARLRNLRDLAMHSGDEDLVWALSGVMRYQRLGRSAAAGAELSQMQSWCHLPVVLPTGW